MEGWLWLLAFGILALAFGIFGILAFGFGFWSLVFWLLALAFGLWYFWLLVFGLFWSGTRDRRGSADQSPKYIGEYMILAFKSSQSLVKCMVLG